MARVFIGVGHGGTDPGAVGYLVEKDVNLKMARAATITCRQGALTRAFHERGM